MTAQRKANCINDIPLLLPTQVDLLRKSWEEIVKIEVHVNTCEGARRKTLQLKEIWRLSSAKVVRLQQLSVFVRAEVQMEFVAYFWRRETGCAEGVGPNSVGIRREIGGNRKDSTEP